MELNIRPMTKAEHMYCYSQSQQISMQTGLIGYLRADMDSNGKGFFSTFFDFRDDLKSENFKAEFDDVINALCFDDSYGGVLKDRSALGSYCYRNPESSIGSERREYGFRADTQNYSYLLRLNPNRGEYNLYCYCYQKKWLDRHLKQAERGIRFIDPNYKELFRLPDGGKIRVLLAGGGHVDHTCRYIDEYHVEFGDRWANLYHICELAERMAQNGNTVIPMWDTLPDKCFALLPSSGEIIEIAHGESGYKMTQMHSPEKSNREIVDMVNGQLGITRAQEKAMLAGSLFGWQTPAADPKNYDENGKPLRVKAKDRSEAR